MLRGPRAEPHGSCSSSRGDGVSMTKAAEKPALTPAKRNPTRDGPEKSLQQPRIKDNNQKNAKKIKAIRMKEAIFQQVHLKILFPLG